MDKAVENALARIVVPKTLNVNGASYIWAVFMGIVSAAKKALQELQ